MPELERLAAAVSRTFRTPDGQWMLVSVHVTALVAAVIVTMSMSAEPATASRSADPRYEQAALPYDLLSRLAGGGSLPGIAAEDPARLTASYHQAGLIVPGFGTGSPSLDGVVAAETEAATSPGVETRMLTMASGDTIIGMLENEGIDARDAHAIVEAMSPIFSARTIRSGQTFRASFGLPEGIESVEDGAERLLALTFSPSIEREITVRWGSREGYSAENIEKQLDVRHQHAGATIDSSLYLAAMQAGIPANVVVEMIHMFSYDVDFQRDVHPGDRFEVFFNHYFTPDGVPAKSGDIMAASMTLDGKEHRLYRFETADGIEYFDETGQSAKSMLMKTPVDGARLSSGFGMRRHPVLGYTRMHKGIDFAVPTGTPIMAAGSGTVGIASVQSGYGKFVLLNHSNGYSTAYGHLSRFANGIKPGARVRQGQIIGYAGMTGLATGPHLHYEIRVAGNQVNPLSVKVASGRKLMGADLTAFDAERTRVDGLLASTPMQTRLAAAQELRETREQ